MNILTWTLGALILDKSFRDSFLANGADAVFIYKYPLTENEEKRLNDMRDILLARPTTLEEFDGLVYMICKRWPCPPPAVRSEEDPKSQPKNSQNKR